MFKRTFFRPILRAPCDLYKMLGRSEPNIFSQMVILRSCFCWNIMLPIGITLHQPFPEIAGDFPPKKRSVREVAII